DERALGPGTRPPEQADPSSHVRRPLIPRAVSMSPRFAPVLAAAALGAALLAPEARACDSSSCVLVTRGFGALQKGAFTVDLSFRYTDDSKRLDGGSFSNNVVLPRIDFAAPLIL